MYMMSRDHLTMHIDAASLQLMLRLLSIDSAAAPHTSSDDDELCRMRLRLHDIVQQAGAHYDVTLDNMTVSCVLHCLFSFVSNCPSLI